MNLKPVYPLDFKKVNLNAWSQAGHNDASDVNFFSLQYFINYNFNNGWYISSTPTITADWEANNDDRRTVPFGGGVGRLVKFGKQPVDLKLQGFYNVENPKGTADWSPQLLLKLLFPKKSAKKNNRQYLIQQRTRRRHVI